LDILVVDFGPICAFQVGQHQAGVVFLYLQVKATDALVVQLDRIAFLATDRDRRIQFIVDAPAIGSVDNTQYNPGHSARLRIHRPVETGLL